MSLAMPNFYVDRRPPLQRSRSHTDPSSPAAAPPKNEPAPDDGGGVQTNQKPKRPSHSRSKSYLAPSVLSTSDKRQPNSTLDRGLEKLPITIPRLHLHSHRHSHSHAQNQHDPSSGMRRHRTTASVQMHSRQHSKVDSASTLPHLMAGLNAERSRAAAVVPRATPGNPPLFGAVDANANDFAPGGRYRSSSNPPPPLRPKTSFEEALERGDAARHARRIHVRLADIVRRDAELREAEQEMRSRLADATHAGVDITRRLDYGYYNVLEKRGNLASTLQSFHTLARQSAQLITNFDREVGRLDADTRRRVDGFKAGFAERARKAAVLQERAARTGTRAEELSRRLENARTVVDTWERREESARKRRDRVVGTLGWGVVVVLVLLVTVVVGKEWYFGSGPVKVGLHGHGEGSWNESLRLGGSPGSRAESNERMVQMKESIPGEVKELLAEIANRNRQGKGLFSGSPEDTAERREEIEAGWSGNAKIGADDSAGWSRSLDEL